jgi:hypothetical protein
LPDSTGSFENEGIHEVLAVNLIMVEDPEKLAAMRQHYEQRQECRVRDNGRISKEAAIKIAWSHVLAKAARRAVKARWKRSTPEERKAISDRMHAAKAAKRALRTGTRKAA